MTVKVVLASRAEPDPRERIASLMEAGLTLPHGAEAAIRVWSAINPEVRSVQAEVDRQRFEALYESTLEILHDDRQAKLFAAWAIHLLVGYEQAILPPDTDGLAWIVAQQLDLLDRGRFNPVPDGD